MKRSFYSYSLTSVLSLLLLTFSFLKADILEANWSAVKNGVSIAETDDINGIMGGNVITTLPIPAGQFCRSSSVVVNFEAEGSYPAPNTFIAQLSDETGDFSSPVNLGSLSLAGNDLTGAIFGVFPGAVTPGSGYRIRVVSTAVPSAIALDNGSDLAIQSLIAPPIPTVNVNGPLQFCFGSASTFLTSSSPVNNLWFPGGINTQPFLGVVASGNYYTQVTGSNGCVTSSVPVTITVNTPIFTFLSYLDDDGLIVTAENPQVSICEGESIPMVILVDGGVAPYQIIYSSDFGQQEVFFLDGASDSTVVNISQPGTYTVLGLVDSFPTNCGITLGGSSGSVTLSTVPRPDINFFYEPYCGDISEEPVLSENWIAGGTFAFLTAPGDGATVDANTGVISNSVANATYTITYEVLGPDCFVRDTATVTVQPSDIVAFSYNAICPGITELTPMLSEGFTEGGVFSFQAEPGDGATIDAATGALSNLVAGNTYIIEYTSPDGECQNTGSATVEPGENPIVTADITNALCNDPIGAISLTVTGGTEPYVFEWSTGAATQDISGLEAGTYEVTVTGADACKAEESFTIVNDNEPELSFDVTNATCNIPTGSITVSVVAGTGAPEFSFQWEASAGNSTNQTVSNLAPGAYSVVVTDDAGCEIAGSASIILEDGPQIENVVIENTTCGNNDGSINFNIAGGQPEFIIDWSNNASGLPLSGLEAGSYAVTITDDNGCEISETFSVVNTNQFTITIAEVIQPTCLDTASGSIFVNLTGGTPEFTFQWNDLAASQTQNLENVGAGTYQLIVTDNAGCIDSVEAAIDEIFSVQVVEDIVNPDCGQENGSITLTVTGGSGAFNFVWSDDANINSAVRENLAVGSYDVTITDANDASCSFNFNFSLNFENVPELELIGINTACDVDTGSATVIVTGGSGVFTVLWTPGDFTTETTGPVLAPGNYSVTVTDENGCEAAGDVTIINIDVPELTATVVNTSCGNDNGILDVSVSGGTEPFEIIWSNGSTELDQFGLAAGDYSYELTDAKGCVITGSFTINPSVPVTALVETEPSSCGSNLGSITVTLSNTTGAVTYNWTFNGEPFANTQNISGLAAGTYELNAFDAAGCIINETVEIENADQPVINADITNASCGEDDGSITISVENGSGVFTVLWEDGSTDLTLSNLEAGCYSVEIVDENGCEAAATFCVENAEAPVLALEIVQPSCGQANGEITLTIDGGTAPFTIEWNNSSDELVLNNLEEGTYTVTVTDAANCFATAEAILIQTGTEILVFADVVNSSCGFDDGSITLTVTGGTEPYTIEWAGLPPEFNGPVLNDISAGIYEVTITDAEGCSVTELIPLLNDVDFDITAVVTDATCGQADGAIDVTVVGGSGFGLISWYLITGDGFEILPEFDESIVNLTAGTYRFIIFEKDGCADSLDIVVGNVVDFEVNATIENPGCGASNGSISLTINGGTGPFTFLWNDANASTTQNLENVPAGIYTVIITDSNDCEDTQTFTIEEGPSDVVIAISGTDASCGQCNGTISIEITSGEAPFTFEWNNDLSGQNPTEVCQGTYSVIVTDANGCTATAEIEIGGTPALVINAEVIENTLCNQAIGSATVTIESGTSPFDILWSNDETTATIENLAAGAYNVTVVDANLCEATASVNIVNANEPNLSVAFTNPSCDDPASGSITIIIEDAAEPFVVTLNGVEITEFNITGLTAGLYEIQLTDASSCEVSETVNLVNEDAPSADITITETAICEGETATVTISLTGQAPFDLSYFNGFAIITVTGLTENTLTFDVNPLTNATYSLISLVSQDNPSCPGFFINDQVTLTVNPLPTTPNITAEGELSICPGEEVILTSDITENIVWSPNGETSAVITATAAGIYFVTVTNEFGCSAVSNSIEIEANPLPVVSAGEDITICQGSSTQLQATGADSYVWSPSIGLSGTIISNPTASPLITTTYTVTGTNACGSSVDTIIITVLPVVESGLPEELTVCENSELTLSANEAAGVTYEWGPAFAINGATSESSASINTSVDVQVFVTITNTNNCVITDTVNITLIPAPDAPVITAQSDTVFCQGESVILTSTVGEGVTWSNGIQNVLSILVTESGTYTATINDGTCSSTSNAITVVVQEQPVATITPSGNQTICEGQSVDLTSADAVTYNWTTPSGVETTQSVNASIAGEYTLVVTNEAGCESNPLTVAVSVVSNPPQPTITLNGPADLCEGDIVTLTSSVTSNFTWIINGTPSGLSTPSVSTNAPGTYQVEVTNSAGCSSISEIVSITVKPNLPPIITADSDTIVCGDQAINITLTASAGFTAYEWFPGGETSQSLIVTEAGTYFVTGTNQNGCQASSFINIIQSPVINAEINSPLYNNGFNISTIGGSDGVINTTVSGGTPDFTYTWADNSTIVTSDRSNLPAGTYSVIITDAVGCSVELTITLTAPSGLLVPNGFTPNGDGFNDRFVVQGLEGYPSNTLTVFNRWGNIVFQQRGYNNDWVGVNNSGDNVPEGTYFIILEVDGFETITGYVDLRR